MASTALPHPLAHPFHQLWSAYVCRDFVEPHGNIRAIHLGVHEDFDHLLDYFSERLVAGLLTSRLYRGRNPIDMLFHYRISSDRLLG